MTSDHLGTPRVVTDQTGTVLSWHDYQPFGEEITSTSTNAGARSSITQFNGSSDPRQKFTSKERDTETGLNYFEARYYASTQGRFTSTDPQDPNLDRQSAGSRSGDAEFLQYLSQPQHWNRYTYTLNNPIALIDPDGREAGYAYTATGMKSPYDKDFPKSEHPVIDTLLVAGIVGGAIFGPEVPAWIVANPITAGTAALQAGNVLLDMSQGGPGNPASDELFIAGSLAEGESRLIANAAKGKEFEGEVLGILGVEKNTERIMEGTATGANFRVPDMLNHISDTMGEIKNVKDLSLTGQLQDFINYAGENGVSFNLYVKPGTTLTKPLRQELKRIGAKVFDVVNGKTVERTLE